MKNRPTVLAFAGPNGSGKSTVTRSLPVLGTYVNADDLKAKYKLSDLEAAQQSEAIRNELLNRQADFSFETVLSTDRNLLLLKKAKEKGYDVQCIYILTCDENINVARVRARVVQGGHSVPEDKIRSRYHRALALLTDLIEVCDKILIYDNSVTPTLIFKKENGVPECYPNELWPEDKLKALLEV
ncbi:MAG: zeta toxin family protein [Oscillospiraceae bacterium]|nr:zeta toxin family protein [Oscillospiraceae bacterium]